jgi:hypothetical protein
LFLILEIYSRFSSTKPPNSVRVNSFSLRAF